MKLRNFKEVSEYYVLKSWALHPQLSLLFKTRSDALFVFKKVKKEVSYKIWILELIETEDQFVLAMDEDDKPDWM